MLIQFNSPKCVDVAELISYEEIQLSSSLVLILYEVYNLSNMYIKWKSF